MDVESKLNYFQESRNKHAAAEEGLSPARKRIEGILDSESFIEFNTFMKTPEGKGKEIISGAGTIDERPVYILAQDSQINNGVITEKGAQKITGLVEQAGKTGSPLINIIDSSGVQIENGLESLKFYGRLYSSYIAYSGVIPLISLVAGSSPGGLSFMAGLSDFVFGIKKQSKIFLNSPSLIKEVTGEDVNHEELGGFQVSTEKNGVIHFQSDDEEESCRQIRRLVSFLPLNNLEEPPIKDNRDDVNRFNQGIVDLISEGDKGYDVRNIIREIADQGYYLEVQEKYAENLSIGLISINGYSLGVVANQPAVLSGCLDLNACEKGSRFIRLCDAFNIPVLTLVDAPGFLPTAYQEHSGIVRNGAKLLFAYAGASVPKVTLILRRSYGAAGVSMGSKYLGVDQVLAWPTAEIGVLSPQGLSNILSLAEEDMEKSVSPYEAAAHGLLDDVIDPQESRPRIAYALEFFKTRRQQRPGKKHGNFPV